MGVGLKVVVIGAGIGGLTLAQALRRAGDEVRVYDRDATVDATGGYRLHLDEAACAALRRHLAPAHYQALQASSAGSTAFRHFAVTDHRMRPLLIDRQDPAAQRLLIGRIPLRRLLAHGLGDVVRFGAEFTHHSTNADGTVTAHFADGSTAGADLLVGADGVGSRVATALAGRPTSAPAGASGIAGRVALTDRNRAEVPTLLQGGPALAFGPGAIGLFLSVHDLANGTALGDTAHDGQVPAQWEPPALVWGLITADRRLPDEIRGHEPAALVTVADQLLAGWAPPIRSLIRSSDPASAVYFRFNAADPTADLMPWRAERVTALGDAVHAMPPTGGQGAATAIRDADLLATLLTAVRAGDSTLAEALRAYQLKMAAYAPDAVRESLAPLRWMRTSGTPGGTLVARIGLPVAASVAAGYRALRRRGGRPLGGAARRGR